MRLAIIRSSGHYPVVLEGLSEQEEMTICAIAPGCREEDITPLAEACAENGHAPAVWEDWKEMLSAEQPGLAPGMGRNNLPFRSDVDSAV